MVNVPSWQVNHLFINIYINKNVNYFNNLIRTYVRESDLDILDKLILYIIKISRLTIYQRWSVIIPH